MTNNYSQLQAMLAVTKASLRATFRSPQSIFFSLFFPIVLIWIFGSIGGNGTASVDVAFEKGADTTSFIARALLANPVLHFVKDTSNKEEALSKGKISAIINITHSADSLKEAPYSIQLRTSSAAQREYALLQSVLGASIQEMNRRYFPDNRSVATISQTVVHGREYKMIDFFLPGMIGFSLIGAAVFGVAFVFYSLRETLVLKRMYSTPIKRSYIILGESLSRVIFQMMTVVVLIGFGFFVYHFHLAHGLTTFLEMLFLCFLALLVFMGFGFFISSVSKNQNVIPIYANLFMFPQYFLSGTFFPRTALPSFLQGIIKFLPLTALNDAMRNVAFEGSSLASCWQQIVILLVWGVVVYACTAKAFRWE